MPFGHLQIPRRPDRLLVGLADAALAPAGWRRRPPPAGPVRRVLLLRLERIGDLLMAREAIARVVQLVPDAAVDLAIGSWNRPLAELLPGIGRLHTIDVPWLARDRGGASWPALLRAARAWRRERYDLVVNFEPDIRSNLLAWLSGAPRRAGYGSGGGGALLTHVAPYDPAAHVGENADRLVDGVLNVSREPSAGPTAPLALPRSARARADAVLAGAGGRLVGVHASGGRPSKQWHPDRFAAVAAALARDADTTIVLTGSDADRALADQVAAGLGGARTVDAVGRLDLPALAALVGRLDLLITGDTGPMHVADAVGTPMVALFGPSDPRRYGPRHAPHRVLRIDLWCSPCGRVRLPPARCRGRVPECLDGLSVETVLDAARELLAATTPV